MKNFDAKTAKELTESTMKGELNDVLSEIRDQALRGKYVLHLSRPLKRLTIESLSAKGFKVSNESSIAIQHEQHLYHTISWES